MKFLFLALFLVSEIVNAQVLPDSGVQIIPKVPSSTPLANEVFPGAPTSNPQSSMYRRSVIDLLAIPHSGETYVGANYVYDSSSRVDSNDDLLKNKSNKTIIYAEKAMTENLSAQAQIGYLLSESTYTGSNNLGNSKGITDPLLGVNYRALDISRDRYDLNLNPYFSPSLQEATSSSPGTDGNGARGYSYLGVKAGLGRREDINSWAVSIDLFNAMNGHYKNTDTGEEVKTSSRNGVALTGQYMKKLTGTLSLKGELGIAKLGSMEYKFENGSTYTSSDSTIFSASGTGYLELYKHTFLTSSLAVARSRSSPVGDQNNAINTNHFTFSLGFLTQF